MANCADGRLRGSSDLLQTDPDSAPITDPVFASVTLLPNRSRQRSELNGPRRYLKICRYLPTSYIFPRSRRPIIYVLGRTHGSGFMASSAKRLITWIGNIWIFLMTCAASLWIDCKKWRPAYTPYTLGPKWKGSQLYRRMERRGWTFEYTC